MANFSTYRHKSYDGGLNNAASRRDIERNQASLLENWDISEQGRLKSRKGLTLVGSSLGSKIDSFGVYRQQGSANYLLTNAGTNVYKLSSGSWSSIGTITQAERLSYANVMPKNKIYLSSENNGLLSYDGTTLSAVSGGISGNVIIWYQNHLFHLNNVNVSSTKYPYRIYWSDFGDPETYDTTNNFIEPPGEGKIITANVLGDTLVIFREDSYMFLSGYGSSSWQISASSTSISNTDSSVGCPSPTGTVRVGPSELWFMDNQGYVRRITVTQYGYSSKVMSNNLNLDNITINGVKVGINKSKLNNTIAWYDDDKVYFAVTSNSSTYNDVLLVFDRKASARNGNREAWTTYTGWTVTAMTSFTNDVNPTLYIGDDSGNIYTHTGGSDNGNAINCRWDSRNDDYDMPERYKKYTYGYIYSQAQTDQDVTIHSSVDGMGFAQIGSFNLQTDGTALGPTGPATMGPTGTFILGGNFDKEKKYYYSDGGGVITGKTVTMSIRTSTTEQIYVDTFTNHFVVRSLK